jgi:hypothetical protein
MFKKFRFIFIAVFSGILMLSCLKKTGRKQVEENLEAAMDLFLNHKPGVDTSQVKFNVLSVTFYEDKRIYRCEFRVNMKQKLDGKLKDTTGIMGASISKDFKNVSRSF